LIGEETCASVDFTNSAGGTGFGPYIVGITDADVTISSVSFINIAPIIEPIGTFGPSGELVDPITENTISGNEGGSASILRYPVGSVDTASPALVLDVCVVVAAGAQINVPLEVSVIPGFEFGSTPTGDSGAISGGQVTSTVTPQLARVEKTNSAPEGERPPGPSHTFTYAQRVDISQGVTLDNVNLTDTLPPQLQWTGGPINITAPLGVGCAVTNAPNAPADASGGDLIVDCSAVTGTAGEADLVVTFPAYIVDILDEAVDDSQLIENTVDIEYQYQGDDYSDFAQSQVLAVHAAMQKSVTGDALPGGSLTYAIDFQLTDYPGMGSGASDFIITDILPNGTAFDSTVELRVNGSPVAISAAEVAGPGSGETTVTWDIGAAFGGTLPNASDGQLRYRVDILQTYAGPGNVPVQANDELLNAAELEYTLTEGGSAQNDSQASAVITPNVAAKTILNPPPPTEVMPGEAVTFLLDLEIPAGDSSNVVFVDYLPRPVFDVRDFDTVNGWTVLPPFAALMPDVSVDVGQNSVSFDFGDLSTTGPARLALELTAMVSGEPFADDLFLTNLFGSFYDNAIGQTTSDLQAAPLRVGAPDLMITKGVFSVANPAAVITPAPPADPGQALVTGDARGADAFDEVVFVITVENIGGQPAYAVTITDAAVNGLDCPGAPTVTNGNGDTLTFTGGLQSAGGLVLDDPLPGNDDNPPSGGAPFGADTALLRLTCTLQSNISPGERLTNTAGVTWVSTPGGGGSFPTRIDDAVIETALPEVDKSIVSIAPGYAMDGRLATIGEVVTYSVAITVPEGQSPAVRFEDLLDLGLAHVEVLSITASSAALTTDAGSFADVLNNNLGYLAQGGGTTGPDRKLVFGPTNLASGFGLVTNSNSDNATDETLTIVYRTRVLNAIANVANISLRNRARWYWTPAGGTELQVQDRAPAITLVEPALSVSKTFTPNIGDNSTPPLVTIELAHSGTSGSDAFDLLFTDKLPVDMEIPGGAASVSLTNCPATTRVDVLAETTSDKLEIEWAALPTTNGVCIIEFQSDFRFTPLAGITLNNCAQVQWQSLSAADQPLPAAPNNTIAVERTGDTDAAGGAANTYLSQGCDLFKVFDVGIEKTVSSTSQPQTDAIPGTPAGAESLTIGEEVTFELVVTLPAARAVELEVTDLLPTNGALLEVLSARTVRTGSDLSFSPGGDDDPVADISDDNSDGFADKVVLNYGRVVNTGSDGATDADRIVIEVVAKVLDSARNQNNDLDANRAIVRFLPGLESSAEQPVEIVEPLLDIDKSADVSEVEAGDEITYQVRVQHSAASRVDAQDVNLTDQLPTDLQLVPGSAQIGSVCDTPPSSGPTEVGNGFSAQWAAFPLGGVCDIAFRALVSRTAITGNTLVNEAQLAWTSLNTQGDTEDRDYATTDQWTVLVSPPGLNKLLTDTSIPETTQRPLATENDLTIGETATFTIAADFPDGTTLDAVLTDLLPSDGVALDFLPGSSRIIAIGGDLQLSSGLGIGDAATACTPPDSNCLSWSLGDIINAEDTRPEPDLEDRIVFEVTAIVLDDAANVGTGEDDNKRNTATLTTSESVLGDIEQFNIVEPLLGIRKLTGNGVPEGFTEAAQEERFRLVIEHTAASSAAAFNLEIVDELAPEMLWIEDPLEPLASDCPGFTVVSTPSVGSSGILEFTVDALPLATRSCEISFKVQMDPALGVPGLYRNDVTLDWESAPGSPQSRTYSDMARARLFADADNFVVKRVGNTSLDDDEQGAMDPSDPLAQVATIGEVISYELVAVFTEGTSTNVSLVDTFQQDGDGTLALVSGNVAFVGDNITTSLPGMITMPQADPEIEVLYGTVENLADGVTDQNDSIAFTLQLQVPDEPANMAGDRLLNTVELMFDGIAGVITVDSAVDVLIVEPQLSLNKTFTGLVLDEATLRLELENTGTSAAFDTVITDVFSDSLWVPGSLVPITVPPGFAISESVAGNDITVEIAAASAQTPPTPEEVLLPGENLVVEFSLRLQNNGQPGPTSIPNTATAEATSLPGPDAAERTYTATAQDTLELPELALQKTWIAPGNPAEPGDLVTYTLTLANTGAAPATDIVITDTPDSIGEFQVGSVNTSTVGSGASVTVVTGNNPGDTQIRATSAALAAGGSIIVTYDVRIPLPYPDADGAAEALENQAAAESAEISPLVSDDPTTAADDDATIVPLVADPIMTIDKMDGVLFSSPGSVLSYNLQYGNAGNQDATGVVITETVPDFTTFEANASTPGWVCDAGGAAGDTCRFTVGDLSGGSSADIIFAVLVDTFVPSGVSEITNTVSIADDGRENDSNAPVIPSVDDDLETTPLVAAPVLEILKDDGGQSVVPGQTFFYTLTYRNLGNQVATGVVIDETVPLHTTFSDAASGNTNWDCADGSLSGTTCQTLVGDLVPGASAQTAQFGLRVLTPAAAGADFINNTARIRDDGNNGLGVVVNDQDSDVTPIIANPDLTILKINDAGFVKVDQTITYELTYRNVGNQDATGAVVRETVPRGTEFARGASLPTTWSCPPRSPGGTVCTALVGDLGAGQGGVLQFAVQVVREPRGSKIENVARTNDDGNNGADPTPENNITRLINSFRPKEVPALPTLGIIMLSVLVGLGGAARLRKRRRQ
jgi:uncharacterized repeat protein (TIGR01451 family)